MRILLLIVQLIPLFALAGDPSSERELHPLSALEAPLHRETVSDPVFGHSITRVVGEAGSKIGETEVLWSRPARHIYSSVAAWDCSDSLLALRNSGATKSDGSGAYEWVLLDGKTFAPLGFIESGFTEFRWWNTKPGRMLLIRNDGLFDYDPIANDMVAITSAAPLFDRYLDVSLKSQGNLSDDDRAIVLVGKRKDSSERHAVLFSLAEGRIIVEIPLAMNHLDYATISPSGNFIVVNGAFTRGEGDRTGIYDRSGDPAGALWEPYGTPSHYDLLIDEAGREVAVGVAKTAPPKLPW